MSTESADPQVYPQNQPRLVGSSHLTEPRGRVNDVRNVSHQAESGQYITLYFQQLWPPNNSSHLVMLESLMSIHPVALTVILSLE